MYSTFFYEGEDEADFELDGLLPGPYDLVVTTERGECAVVRGLRVALDAPIEGLRVELQPGARLRFLPPRERADVTALVLRNGERVAWCWSDADGPYLFTVPAGELTLRLMDWEGELLDERVLEAKPGEVVDVEVP